MVILIPYNPIAHESLKAAAARPLGMFEGSPRETIEVFKRELERARIPATVRLTRGRDIEAACGQPATMR